MKTKVPMDPAAAFPDAAHPPNDAALSAAIGAGSSKNLQATFAELRAAVSDITTAWQFSTQCGWYQLWMLKKRRLLYVIPKRGDLRASLILGGKALDALKAGTRAREVERLLKSAKRYPEGTAFSFDGAHCEPTLLAALLTAKMNH